MTRNGSSTSRTSQDAEKNTGPEWVRKATTKSTPLDLQKNKETFQEAKTFINDPSQLDCRYCRLGAYCSKHLVALALCTHRRLPHLEGAMRMRWKEVYNTSYRVA